MARSRGTDQSAIGEIVGTLVPELEDPLYFYESERLVRLGGWVLQFTRDFVAADPEGGFRAKEAVVRVFLGDDEFRAHPEILAERVRVARTILAAGESADINLQACPHCQGTGRAAG